MGDLFTLCIDPKEVAMFNYDSYMRAVAEEQQARPDAAPGRVHYDVLVTVAPQVAFAVTDSRYNPCFH